MAMQQIAKPSIDDDLHRVVHTSRHGDDLVAVGKAIFDTVMENVERAIKLQLAEAIQVLQKSLEAEAAAAIVGHLDKGMGDLLREYKQEFDNRSKQMEEAYRLHTDFIKSLVGRPMKKTISYDEQGRPQTILETQE